MRARTPAVGRQRRLLCWTSEFCVPLAKTYTHSATTITCCLFFISVSGSAGVNPQHFPDPRNLTQDSRAGLSTMNSPIRDKLQYTRLGALSIVGNEVCMSQLICCKACLSANTIWSPVSSVSCHKYGCQI